MRSHLFALAVAATLLACYTSPAAGNALGFDFKTTPCRFTPVTAFPDFNRPCDIPPRNATTGEFYDFQISADETEACCPWVSGKEWYWIRVDKNDFLGATRPADPPSSAPAREAASNLPSVVPTGASDPFNEDSKPPSAAGARSLAAAAICVAVAALMVLL